MAPDTITLPPGITARGRQLITDALGIAEHDARLSAAAAEKGFTGQPPCHFVITAVASTPVPCA